MARLPAYVPNLDLQTGGQLVREISADTSMGRALGGLGEDLHGFAVNMRQEQANEDAKAESREFIASTRLSLDFEQRAAKLYDERLRSTGPDPTGLYDNYTKDLDEDFAKLWSDNGYEGSPNADKIRLQFDRVRGEYRNRALNAEADLWFKYKKDTNDQYLANLKTSAAASPENAASALQEWSNFVDTSNPNMSQGVKQAYKERGYGVIAASATLAAGLKDPVAFKTIFQPIIDGKAPPENLPPYIQAAMKGAREANFSPDTILAIASIESANFHERYVHGTEVPRHKDGRPMSSAQGMFQVLSARSTLEEIGITKDEKWDYVKVARGLGNYINRQKEWMASRGIQSTPGSEYMFWNMGPGMARAVLTAPAGTKMRDLAVRVLGSKGPAYVATWLRNNPGLYRADSDVSDVRARYDRKVAQAAEKVNEKFGTSGVATDDMAKEAASKLVGPQLGQFVTMSSLGEVYARVQEEHTKSAKANADFDLGNNVAKGDIAPVPGDPDQKRALNKVAESQKWDASGITSGSSQEYLRLGQIVSTFRNIPDNYQAAIKATLAGSDAKTKVAAYGFLAELKRADPATYGSASFGEHDADVKTYIGYTDVQGFSPADAVKMIEFDKSPKGRNAEEARKNAGKKGELAKELARRNADELTSKMESWMPFDEPSAEGQREVIETAYRTAYRYYRESVPNSTEASAKAMAQADLTQMFTRTKVFSRHGGHITLGAPEAHFKPKRVAEQDIPAEIERQAMLAARTHLAVAGYDVSKDMDAPKIAGRLDMVADEDAFLRSKLSLVANGDTLRKIRKGETPTYELWYSGGKSGMMKLDGAFSPSELFANAHAYEQHEQSRKF